MKRRQSRRNLQPEGICRLTGTRGPLVKSHLIPKALTQPTQKGAPFFQYSSGAPPVRRWSSWYDPKLVTQSGEDILTELDTWAVSQLRKHKLVWSGWGSLDTLGSLHRSINGTPWGIREVHGIDPHKLRLFFLSLLWRAAATDLTEFSEVQLPEQDLELLRQMIYSKVTEPLPFYPAQLTQLSTVGVIHNQTPIAEVKTIPSLEDGMSPRDIPIFRFYLDGLLVHIHRHSSDDGFTAEIGNMIVGASDSLLLPTVTYDGSYQRMNLEAVMSESS